MDFVERFKRSSVYTLLVGLATLGILGFEWKTGVLHYRGEHRAGGWDNFVLFRFFGVCGVVLTVLGVWGLVRPSGEDEE